MRDVIVGLLLLACLLFFAIGLVGLIKPSIVRLNSRKQSVLVGFGGSLVALIVAAVLIPEQPKKINEATPKPIQNAEKTEQSPKPAQAEPQPPVDTDLIRTGASSLNLALVMRYDKSVTCADPRAIDGSWFTICHNVGGAVEKRSVWEIKTHDKNVIAVAQNGKAMAALDAVGQTFDPGDGMTKPITLDKGVAPQKVSPERVFQEFGGY